MVTFSAGKHFFLVNNCVKITLRSLAINLFILYYSLNIFFVSVGFVTFCYANLLEPQSMISEAASKQLDGLTSINFDRLRWITGSVREETGQVYFIITGRRKRIGIDG